MALAEIIGQPPSSLVQPAAPTALDSSLSTQVTEILGANPTAKTINAALRIIPTKLTIENDTSIREIKDLALRGETTKAAKILQKIANDYCTMPPKTGRRHAGNPGRNRAAIRLEAAMMGVDPIAANRNKDNTINELQNKALLNLREAVSAIDTAENEIAINAINKAIKSIVALRISGSQESDIKSILKKFITDETIEEVFAAAVQEQLHNLGTIEQLHERQFAEVQEWIAETQQKLSDAKSNVFDVLSNAKHAFEHVRYLHKKGAILAFFNRQSILKAKDALIDQLKALESMCNRYEKIKKSLAEQREKLIETQTIERELHPQKLQAFRDIQSVIQHIGIDLKEKNLPQTPTSIVTTNLPEVIGYSGRRHRRFYKKKRTWGAGVLLAASLAFAGFIGPNDGSGQSFLNKLSGLFSAAATAQAEPSTTPAAKNNRQLCLEAPGADLSLIPENFRRGYCQQEEPTNPSP